MLFATAIPPVLMFLVVRIVSSNAVRIWRARKGGSGMIRLKLPRMFAAVTPVEAPAPVHVSVPRTSLCAGCLFEHIVRGYEPGEMMIFCVYAYPQREILFPVRECTDYADRRVPGASAEASATGRRFSFVTTLSLQDKDENS